MKIKLELIPAHLQLIGKGLEELPYKFAAPVIAAINEQIQAYEEAEKAQLESERDRDKPVKVAA